MPSSLRVLHAFRPSQMSGSLTHTLGANSASRRPSASSLISAMSAVSTKNFMGPSRLAATPFMQAYHLVRANDTVEVAHLRTDHPLLMRRRQREREPMATPHAAVLIGGVAARRPAGGGGLPADEGRSVRERPRDRCGVRRNVEL